MKNRRKLKITLITLSVVAFLVILIMVPHMFIPTISNSLSVSAHLDSAPLMVAHRGLSSLYPQNTVPAFEAALEYGFDGYEFDVHTTKDGKWVVIHDDTVDAMTDGSGEVEDFTFDEIRQLKIDSGNGIENYENLIVPTLEESLAVCESSDIIPVIEIKKCDVEYLPDLKAYLDEKELSQRAVIISFDKEYLEKYRELDEDIQIMYLTSEATESDIDWCLEHKTGLNFNYFTFYKSFSAVRYAREKGVKLAAWTVDNTVYKDVMALFGVEIITTNKILP